MATLDTILESDSEGEGADNLGLDEKEPAEQRPPESNTQRDQDAIVHQPPEQQEEVTLEEPAILQHEPQEHAQDVTVQSSEQQSEVKAQPQGDQVGSVLPQPPMNEFGTNNAAASVPLQDVPVVPIAAKESSGQSSHQASKLSRPEVRSGNVRTRVTKVKPSKNGGIRGIYRNIVERISPGQADRAAETGVKTLEKGSPSVWKPVAAVLAIIGTLGVATLFGAFVAKDSHKH
jgi:hypothetical protein